MVWTPEETCVPTWVRAPKSLWPDREPERGRGRSEPLVEANERPLLRAFPAPHERCRELRRIGGAEAVRIREILGERPDFLGREYLVPGGTELRKQPDRCDSFVSRQLAVPNKSREGAPRFERRSPPHDHALQLAAQPAGLGGRGLRATERNDRTRSHNAMVSRRRDRRGRRLPLFAVPGAGGALSRTTAATRLSPCA